MKSVFAVTTFATFIREGALKQRSVRMSVGDSHCAFAPSLLMLLHLAWFFKLVPAATARRRFSCLLCKASPHFQMPFKAMATSFTSWAHLVISWMDFQLMRV